MMNDIVNVANMYAEGLKNVLKRREQWIKKHDEIKAHLKEIADHLNTNAVYKQGFFVDSLHAFNEEINGICSDMPSLAFRSGEMSMGVIFKNNMGETKEYMEQGFHITFNPTIPGEIIVLLFPHYSDLNTEKPPYATLAIIDDLEQLTNELIDQIIIKGLEASFYSSYTGVLEREEENEQPDNIHTSPIGFKRYDTTQKTNG